MTEGHDDDILRHVTHYVTAGCTNVQALDILMVVDSGLDPKAWASMRGVTARAVEQNIDNGLSNLPAKTWDGGEQ